MLYSRGDVVKAYYYWTNKDGQIEGGERPVIIKEVIKPDRYVVIKITRTDRYGLHKIICKSDAWYKMGLYDLNHDSYIDKTATLEISEEEIDHKLGQCPPTVLAYVL